MSHSKKRILIAGSKEMTTNYQLALRYCDIDFEVSLESTDNNFDGLLLPGGGDIDPVFFHQRNKGSLHIDTALDRQQLLILNAFVQAKKPILGICKGMQLINVYFGGDIIQHLENADLHAWNEIDMTHRNYALSGSFLQYLFGKTFVTNSAHHQGCKTLGRHLVPAQYSCDYVLEALYHSTLPIIGVQWHPERMAYDFKRSDTVDGSFLFLYFKSLLSCTHAL